MVLDMKPEEQPLVLPNLALLDVSGDMHFDSIELVGHAGPSRGGEYKILESFLLKG
jgi:hypothetical protein